MLRRRAAPPSTRERALGLAAVIVYVGGFAAWRLTDDVAGRVFVVGVAVALAALAATAAQRSAR